MCLQSQTLRNELAAQIMQNAQLTIKYDLEQNREICRLRERLEKGQG